MSKFTKKSSFYIQHVRKNNSTANIRISEREISSLLDFFQSERKIYSKFTSNIVNKRARKLRKRMGENSFSHAMSTANFA